MPKYIVISCHFDIKHLFSVCIDMLVSVKPKFARESQFCETTASNASLFEFHANSIERLHSYLFMT